MPKQTILNNRKKTNKNFDLNLTVEWIEDAFQPLERLLNRVATLKDGQKRISFKTTEANSLSIYYVELFIKLCYYAIETIELSRSEKNKIVSIQHRAELLYNNVLNTVNSMSFSKEVSQISELTKPYITTDQRAAEEWEAAGFAPNGTTYRDPSGLPRSTDIEVAAKKLGVETLDPEHLRKGVAELSDLTKGTYFSDEEIQELSSNPTKMNRAKKLGLLSTTSK